MSVVIIATDAFKREAKRLAKKHLSLKSDLTRLEQDLAANPRFGVHIRENVYKIRLAVKNKGRGKSGGMCIITFVAHILQQDDSDDGTITVFLLSLYDISDEDSISDRELNDLLATINTKPDEE